MIAPQTAGRKTETLGRAKRKGVGGKEFLPALASCPERSRRVPPPPNFVFRFAKCTARNRLPKFILFGSIEMEVIIILTIILPKLYLYDKWKNNK